MSGSATQLLTALDNASKENEVNLVIELGTDRLIKWVGVYLMLTLAAVAKLSDVIGKRTYVFHDFENLLIVNIDYAVPKPPKAKILFWKV